MLASENRSAELCSVKKFVNRKNSLVKPITDVKWIRANWKSTGLSPGGQYRSKCTPLQRVAIIVPFRKRKHHLAVFLHHMRYFLQLQAMFDYRIFVIEQFDESHSFNRAKLFNIGFEQTAAQFDCFIFHDVELIPIDLKNLYLCANQPRHLSYIIDGKIRYEHIFGGVIALTRKQVLAANGFSNRFWGWGGEDDEARNRHVSEGHSVVRLIYDLQTYIKLPHGKEKLNNVNPKRFALIKAGKRNYKQDGLNTLKYQLISKKKFDSFTLISVLLC